MSKKPRKRIDKTKPVTKYRINASPDDVVKALFAPINKKIQSKK